MGCVSSKNVLKKRRKSKHVDDGGGGDKVGHCHHNLHINSSADGGGGGGGLALDVRLDHCKNSQGFVALPRSPAQTCTVPENKLVLSLLPPSVVPYYCNDGISPESCLPEVINAWELMDGLDSHDEADEADVGEPSESSETAASTGYSWEHGSPVTPLKDAAELVGGTALGIFRAECHQNVKDGADAVEASKAEMVGGVCVRFMSTTEYREKESASRGVSRRRRKELTALTLPTTTVADFPAAITLKEWLQNGGAMFSPGVNNNVVMPNLVCTNRDGSSPPVPHPRKAVGKEMGGGGGLEPDLLEAFKEAVAELEAEEAKLRLPLVENKA